MGYEVHKLCSGQKHGPETASEISKLPSSERTVWYTNCFHKWVNFCKKTAGWSLKSKVRIPRTSQVDVSKSLLQVALESGSPSVWSKSLSPLALVCDNSSTCFLQKHSPSQPDQTTGSSQTSSSSSFQRSAVLKLTAEEEKG